MAKNDRVFDSWNIESREEIDNLASFPLYDDTGKEICIYSSNGCKIAQRGTNIAPGTMRCGVMVNLWTITSICWTQDDSVELEDEPDEDLDEDTPARDKNKVSLSVYPQAFLHDYGHIQAKGPIQLMQPTIETINSSFNDDAQEADISSDGLGFS